MITIFRLVQLEAQQCAGMTNNKSDIKLARRLKCLRFFDPYHGSQNSWHLDRYE